MATTPARSAHTQDLAVPRAFVLTLALFGIYAGSVALVTWRAGGGGDGGGARYGRSPMFDPAAQPPQRHDMFAVITDNPFVMTGIPAARRQELEDSVAMNLASPYVSELHLLNQSENTTFYPSAKLRVYDLGRRSTFLDAIRYANAVLPAKTTFAIANADIVFRHDSVRLLARIRNERAVVALSRHDVVASNGSAILSGAPDLSQDAWFMRTPFPEHPGFDFPLGTLGSDNKAAYLFQELGITVHNWPFDVVVWHFHKSQHRGAKPRLPLPYADVPAHRANLSSFVFSWQRRPLKVAPYRLIQIVSTDLPRFSDVAMRTSAVTNTYVGTGDGPGVLRPLMLRALEAVSQSKRRRRRASSHAHAHASHRRPAQDAHFLDLPWHALAREPNVFETAELLNGIQYSFVPPVAVKSMFAIVPEDLAPVFCAHRSSAWDELAILTQDSARNFVQPLVCPVL